MALRYLPAMAYLPGGQGVLPEPSVFGHSLPAKHVVHVVLPPSEYVPAGQFNSSAMLKQYTYGKSTHFLLVLFFATFVNETNSQN